MGERERRPRGIDGVNATAKTPRDELECLRRRSAREDDDAEEEQPFLLSSVRMKVAAPYQSAGQLPGAAPSSASIATAVTAPAPALRPLAKPLAPLVPLVPLAPIAMAAALGASPRRAISLHAYVSWALVSIGLGGLPFLPMLAFHSATVSAAESDLASRPPAEAPARETRSRR